MLIIEIEKRHNKMVDRIRYPTVSYLPFYYVFFQFLLLTIFNLQANILTTKDILSNLGFVLFQLEIKLLFSFSVRLTWWAQLGPPHSPRSWRRKRRCRTSSADLRPPGRRSWNHSILGPRCLWRCSLFLY